MKQKIIVIIPCFNEAKRLDQHSFVQFALDNESFEFLFVDDGSSDNTKDILNELERKSERLHSLILNENKGKAEAIRSGVHYALGENWSFDYIAYIDADLAVPLSELNHIEKVLTEKPDLKYIMGIRLARLGAHIERSNVRHYLGRVFATIVSFLLREPTYDTQCGAKFIHKDIVRQLFADKFKSRWFFDVEILFRIKQDFPELLRKNQVAEIPLNRWKEVGDSRLKWIDFLKAPIELLSIKSKYSKSKSESENENENERDRKPKT